MRQKQSSSNFALNPFAPDLFTYGSRIDAIGCMVAQLLQAQLLQATAPPMTYMPPEPPVTYMAPSVVEQPSEIGATMDSGFVQRTKVPGMHLQVHEQATFTIQSSSTRQIFEVAPPQYTAGQATVTEVDGPLEQIVEQVSQVPEIIPQSCVPHLTLVPNIDVPVPMTVQDADHAMLYAQPAIATGSNTPDMLEDDDEEMLIEEDDAASFSSCIEEDEAKADTITMDIATFKSHIKSACQASAAATAAELETNIQSLQWQMEDYVYEIGTLTRSLKETNEGSLEDFHKIRKLEAQLAQRKRR